MLILNDYIMAQFFCTRRECTVLFAYVPQGKTRRTAHPTHHHRVESEGCLRFRNHHPHGDEYQEQVCGHGEGGVGCGPALNRIMLYVILYCMRAYNFKQCTLTYSSFRPIATLLILINLIHFRFIIKSLVSCLR